MLSSIRSTLAGSTSKGEFDEFPPISTELGGNCAAVAVGWLCCCCCDPIGGEIFRIATGGKFCCNMTGATTWCGENGGKLARIGVKLLRIGGGKRAIGGICGARKMLAVEEAVMVGRLLLFSMICGGNSCDDDVMAEAVCVVTPFSIGVCSDDSAK